ncbi:MAG: AsmA family protein [Candidatus Binataceae bacterium]
MRRALPIVGAIVGVLVLLFVALVSYAIVNLNGIVKQNRAYILNRISTAIGRQVRASQISASLGWGVMVDVSGVQVADDPAFSPQPMLTAHDVYVKVAFLPLLFHRVKVQKLVIEQPQVHLVRNRAGVLNVSTIGKGASAAPANPSSPQNPAAKPSPASAATAANPLESAPKKHGAGALEAVSVKNLAIEHGRVRYDDQQSGAPPLTINAVDLKITNFTVGTPFGLTLTMAAFGDQQNVSVAGRVGPLAHGGRLDIAAAPLALNLTAGPVTLAQLRQLQLAAIPSQLTISNPLMIEAKLGGTVDAVTFDISGDLTASQVIYQGKFDKPAGVPFTFAASGRRANNRLELSRASLTLASLQMHARDITIAHNRLAARIDTNDFSLAPLAKIVTAMARYNPTGNAALHANLAVVDKKPWVKGEMALKEVALALPGQTPPLSGLSGTIRMDGNSASAGPLTFNLGSGHGKLQAAANSLQPLNATYQFNADTVKLAELMPSRKNAGAEQVNQLVASGTVAGSPQDFTSLRATADVSSPSGMVANVPYRNLALAAAYGARRLDIRSLKLNAYGGAIAASGNAMLAGDRRFDLTFNCDNLNVQQAMKAQRAKAADIIRGILNASLHLVGAGSNFDQIKQTMRGNGRAMLRNGKLVGVNVVAQALNKVNGLPGIGALIPFAVVNRHPELFNNPDTDLQNASLSYILQGPRIISHDINVRTADYSIQGDGWFDLDKRIDMTAQILLTRALSNEIVAVKKNVAFITNQNRQIEIPLRITGQLPKPLVTPDVQLLARRAASHAVENKLGGLLRKKGLGGLLDGGSSGANPLRGFLR